jgi:hypothetical protein
VKSIFRLTLGRLRAQSAQFAIPQIDPVHFALLAFSIKHVAIGGIEQDVKTIAAGQCRPVAVANGFLALDAAQADPVLVVLKSARDPEVRFRIVE